MIDNGRAKIKHDMEQYSITVPSKKNVFILMFVLFWLGGWFLAFRSVFSQLFNSESSEQNGFLVFWLLGWTLGGCAAIFGILWSLFGKEKFIVTQDYVFFSKTIFNIGKKRKLNLTEVSNFQFKQIENNRYNRKALAHLTNGKISFNYGKRTYSFGMALDDAEAQYLVDEINRLHYFKRERY